MHAAIEHNRCAGSPCPLVLAMHFSSHTHRLGLTEEAAQDLMQALRDALERRAVNRVVAGIERAERAHANGC
jgi:hypothetical protein